MRKEIRFSDFELSQDKRIFFKKISVNISSNSTAVLIGDKGSGKSLILKNLAGLSQNIHQKGTADLNGTLLNMQTFRERLSLGIFFISGSPLVIDSFNLYQNLYLLERPSTRYNQYEVADRIFHAIGIQKEGDDLAGELSLRERALLSLARALIYPRQLILVDHQEVLQDLDWKNFIKQVRISSEASILFADEMAQEYHDVLIPVEAKHEDSVIEIFPPRRVGSFVGRENTIRIENFRPFAESDRSIRVEVYPGEIYGIWSRSKSRRGRILKAFSGGQSLEYALRLVCEGDEFILDSPKESIRSRVAFMSGRSRDESLFLQQSVRFNLTLLFHLYNSKLLLSEDVLLRHYAQLFNLNLNAKVGDLSEEEQQSLLLARCLPIKPRLLVLDEPTRALSPRSRQNFYSIIRQLADDGVGIILSSSRIDEYLELCDRVSVVEENQLKDLISSQINRENIMGVG